MNTSRNRSIVFLITVALLLVASPQLLFTIRTRGQAATQPVPVDLLDDWTAESVFQSRVEELRKTVKAVRVIEARARLTTPENKVESCHEGLFTLREKLGAYEIELLRAEGDVGEFRYALRQNGVWSVEASTELSQRTVRLAGNEGALLDLEIQRLSEDSPLLPEVVDSWAYATALLEGDPPVSENLGEKEEERSSFSREASQEFWERLQQVRQEEGEATATALLEKVLNERTINRYDRGLHEEARHAVEFGHVELALRIYRYYIPVGGCSMDQMPRLVAQEYADLCLQQKQLGCFLQLQVRLMGDQFERVAYSSMAAEMNDTATARLEETGIDVDKFLLGLVFDLQTAQTRRIEVPCQRLARGMIAAGRAEVLRPRLEELIQNRQVDEWNRTLAALTLLGIRLYDLHLDNGVQGHSEDSAKKQVGSILADFATMDLPQAFVPYLQSLRESE